MAKLSEQEKLDRRKVTDLIQSMWGEDANWKLLTAQLKNIMKEYNIIFLSPDNHTAKRMKC